MKRLAPFLDLLDARYLPLLFAAAPQSYTVYLWLYHGSDKSGEAHVFAILGAIGFEAIYVGAVAWAERGAGWSAARWPAVTALLFSVAVAVVHYYPTQGALAALHAGFPMVCYFFVLLMHAPATPAPQAEPAVPHPVSHRPAQLRRLVRRLVAEVRRARAHPRPTVALEVVDIAGRRINVSHLARELELDRKAVYRLLDKCAKEAA